MKIYFIRHGQTQNNLDKLYHYSMDHNKHPITERGEKQAIHTGKYLNTFGDFDLVISSPFLRAKQTAEIICKEINYKKEIVYNNLIVEGHSGSGSGLLKTEINDLLMKNKKYANTLEKISLVSNPFDKIKLIIKLYQIKNKIINNTTVQEYFNNIKKFLNYLTKLNKNRILVISHGMFMILLQIYITNTCGNTNLFTIDNKDCIMFNQIEGGNTMLMGCLMENKEIKLIIPCNTLHLQNIM